MSSANGKDKIWIFDTTLRDGEQALRASLSHKQKIQLAHAIARLNVDVMEVVLVMIVPLSDYLYFCMAKL